MAQDSNLNRWLLDNERKAILPFKWALLFVTVLFWLWKTRWMLPEWDVFAVFSTYALLLCGGTYLLLFRRITVHEARVYCTASFLIDVAYVSILIYCDNARMRATGVSEMSDFYYFYFILVLRGYSLSTSQVFNFSINLLIVFIFIVSYALSEASFSYLLHRSFQIKLALLWMIILMSWFIVGLINQQKTEIMSARERLLQAQHLADLGQMAAVVAHEVNTPIGIISANAEYLMKKSGPEDDDYEDFRVIHEESQRCKRIVSELLTYAQPSRDLRLKPVDLGALTQDVIGFVFRRAEDRGVRVTFYREKDLPDALADADAVRRALLNVLVNGRQALKEGGEINVRVAHDDRDRRMVAVDILDNGPGIDPKDIKRAFEPFFTKKTGGTGLGLAVARRVIESQNGLVSIAPREGERGTAVRIRLPIAPPARNAKA